MGLWCMIVELVPLSFAKATRLVPGEPHVWGRHVHGSPRQPLSPGVDWH